MKRIFFCLACLLATMAQAYEGVTVTFNRTGTAASTVTCTVADENGTAITGATATVTCSHAFKATANAITKSILCPNVNANTSPTITLGIKITGLSTDFTFNQAALDIHALNGGSNYQESADNVVRQWNVGMTTNSTAFGSLANIDIAAGITAHHKEWTMKSSVTNVDDDGAVNVQLTITKGTTNLGCFFGLSSLTLSTKTKTKTEDPCPSIPVVTLPCTTLGSNTYLSQLNITGKGVVNELHYNSGVPTTAYNLYTKERATLLRGKEATLQVKLVGKSVSGLTVVLYADYDGDGTFESTPQRSTPVSRSAVLQYSAARYSNATTVETLSDTLAFTLQVPDNTTSTQGRLRMVLDQSGSDDPDEAYGTIYDLPFYIVDLGDLNSDGRVSIGDASTLIKRIKDDESYYLPADIDQNSKVELDDVQPLQKIILNEQ